MSKIPDSFIEELKAKTSLVKYVKQYTLLREVGLGIWQGTCPHPDHDDSTPSFTVWEKTNSWACYGCHTGKKGLDGNLGSDIYAFIQWIEGVNFVKAVHILAEWNNVPVPTDQNQKEYDRKIQEIEDNITKANNKISLDELNGKKITADYYSSISDDLEKQMKEVWMIVI